METITFKSKKLTLTQDAYITSNGVYNCYEALAVDADGNDYKVIWDILDAQCDDESNACDWSTPSNIIAL